MAMPKLAALLSGSKLAVATRLTRILYLVVSAVAFAVGAYNAIYGSTAAVRDSSVAVASILAHGRKSEHWEEACEGPDPAPVCAAPIAAKRLFG